MTTSEIVFSVIGITLAYFALLVPIQKYLNDRRKEEKDKRFERYHDMLKELVASPDPRMSRQMAVVYELRNFPEHYEVSARILKNLKLHWAHLADSPIKKALLDEIDISLQFLDAKLACESKKCF